MSNTTPPPVPDFQPPPPAPPKSRTNLVIIGSAAAVIIAIVATGAVVVNSRDDGGAEPTVAKATNTEASSVEPSAEPSPPAEPLKLGDTADITTDITFSAAALSYKDKSIKGIPDFLSAGQKWAALEVKVCNTGSAPFETSTYTWSLAYADGARVESAGMNAGELPQPVYPMDAKVGADDCVRGHIAFQVPEEGRPERVLYSPAGLDEPVEWQVGK
ncbi:DUF4352 domain-containing protein [Streptomyces sp. NPDC004610]|uniref:DUF4352 domain-containing protein n=1 Tax=unclassified Streptomyces TaxID=2593676 RepID=UPI0033BAACF3